jgi:hypothetical protein
VFSAGLARIYPLTFIFSLKLNHEVLNRKEL